MLLLEGLWRQQQRWLSGSWALAVAPRRDPSPPTNILWTRKAYLTCSTALKHMIVGGDKVVPDEEPAAERLDMDGMDADNSRSSPWMASSVRDHSLRRPGERDSRWGKLRLAIAEKMSALREKDPW